MRSPDDLPRTQAQRELYAKACAAWEMNAVMEPTFKVWFTMLGDDNYTLVRSMYIQAYFEGYRQAFKDQE